MKFSFAPLATLAVAASSLLSAYAYVDYDEFDARSIVDSYGYENLGARSDSGIEVPFQHSLRSFLEEAVAAHRRAVEGEDQLEARAVVNFKFSYKNRDYPMALDTSRTFLVHAMWQFHNTYFPGTAEFVVEELLVFIGERQIRGPTMDADPVLKELNVQPGTTIKLVDNLNLQAGGSKKASGGKRPAKNAPVKAQKPAAKVAVKGRR
ncbi:hypothetical protein DFP72DRAFT_1073904 [Ephemerocybe angulata]|uniref:Uncharacterized protein n=1 Tax=Ephemerocybe angulata TaxID=980116 RepID=A0A8H6HLD0_9AGAR|nr:hypothetical protein DFP72DRAFT_1073904 [Tulosesus angulatus]